MRPAARSNSPRPASVIERQLADLAEVRGLADAYGRPDFASQIGLRSIIKHEKELQEELNASRMLESGCSVELDMDGSPVIGHSIEAHFLGDFLMAFQAFVDVLAGAPRGRHRGLTHFAEGSEATRLMVSADFAPSSFGLRLSLPGRKESAAAPLEPETHPVLVALTNVLSGLDGSEESDRSDVLSGLDGSEESDRSEGRRLRGPVKREYSNLLRFLADNRTYVRIRTRSNPYGVKIHPERAGERLESLQSNVVKPIWTLATLSGTLIAGDVETGRFDLRVGNETIHASPSEIGQSLLRKLTLGTEVEAVFEVETEEYLDEDGRQPYSDYFPVQVQPKAGGSQSGPEPKSAQS